MAKKILIDLVICRDCKDCSVDCAYTFHPGNNGINQIRELAAFSVTCRQCEDAPCIGVCPVSALQKEETNIISRAVNLCVACKSCVTVCPFGSLMNDFFQHRQSICDYCGLNGTTNDLKCVSTCPLGALSITESEENPEEDIYRINDHVLVKDYKWEKLVKLE